MPFTGTLRGFSLTEAYLSLREFNVTMEWQLKPKSECIALVATLDGFDAFGSSYFVNGIFKVNQSRRDFRPK